MSFQDFGKKGSSRPSNASRMGVSNGFGNGSLASASQSGNPSRQDDYTSVSQSILQYQQNVGLLSNIVIDIGTEADGPLLQKQFKLQMDVIKQLATKIETTLEELEQKLQTMPRTEASKNRATQIKLTRDCHYVQTKFKNLQLEAKQKRSQAEMRRRAEAAERDIQREVDMDATNNQRLQMQLQDDKVTEEIMREREEEVRKINQGMHQVNEIYKDLANIVSYQQDQIDEVETHMEKANKNAESGLKQIEKAQAKQDQNCIIS